MDSSGEQYPGAKPAFEFVLPSYQWAIQRFDAMNARIQALATFSATITLGTIGLTARADANHASCWFLIAMIDFLALIITTFVLYFVGELHLVNPRLLHEKWLHKVETKFRTEMVYFAGVHFENNIGIVNRKGRWLGLLLGGFIVEVCLLAGWLLTSVH